MKYICFRVGVIGDADLDSYCFFALDQFHDYVQCIRCLWELMIIRKKATKWAC